MLDFLSKEKRKILLEYPFIKEYLDGKITQQTFLENLYIFKPDLIAKGITDAEIKLLENLGNLEREQNLYVGVTLLTGLDQLSSPLEGEEFIQDVRIVNGREIHLLGETHRSIKPVDYTHKILISEISKDPSVWLLLREDAKTRVDKNLPCHFYFQELADIFNIPYEEAVPHLFDKDTLDYIANRAHETEREILRICLTNILTTSKRNLSLFKQNREGFIDVMSKFTHLPAIRIKEALKDGPSDKLMKNVVSPYWDEFARQKFHEVLNRYKDKKQVIVSVGIGHLGAFH